MIDVLVLKLSIQAFVLSIVNLSLSLPQFLHQYYLNIKSRGYWINNLGRLVKLQNIIFFTKFAP
jgi:hypothetical protein